MNIQNQNFSNYKPSFEGQGILKKSPLPLPKVVAEMEEAHYFLFYNPYTKKRLFPHIDAKAVYEEMKLKGIKNFIFSPKNLREVSESSQKTLTILDIIRRTKETFSDDVSAAMQKTYADFKTGIAQILEKNIS